MRNKVLSLVLITFMTAIMGFFVFLFVNCINLYQFYDLEYSELNRRILTYEKCELIKKHKSSDLYEIYFKEYNEPFEVSGIVKKNLNKNGLNNLKPNESVIVYFIEDESGNYKFEICEMKTDTIVLLDLDDFVKANQDNQILGMIVCPILILSVLFLLILYLKWAFNKSEFLSQIKETKESSNLGKIKLEYKDKNNTIRVYNSLELCSLVINGTVVDRYIGFVSSPFCLRGKIEEENRYILVEAKMGHLFMKLYYDGKLVGKKFMGLG